MRSHHRRSNGNHRGILGNREVGLVALAVFPVIIWRSKNQARIAGKCEAGSIAFVVFPVQHNYLKFPVSFSFLYEKFNCKYVVESAVCHSASKPFVLKCTFVHVKLLGFVILMLI